MFRVTYTRTAYAYTNSNTGVTVNLYSPVPSMTNTEPTTVVDIIEITDHPLVISCAIQKTQRNRSRHMWYYGCSGKV